MEDLILHGRFHSPWGISFPMMSYSIPPWVVIRKYENVRKLPMGVFISRGKLFEGEVRVRGIPLHLCYTVVLAIKYMDKRRKGGEIDCSADSCEQ